MLSPSRRQHVYKEVEASEQALNDAVFDFARSAEIRRDIRSIQPHPVCSAEWTAVCEAVDRLAKASQADALSPTATRDLVGRDNEGEGTLWDQKADESVIRMLVEETKLNACLTMLNDYKIWQYVADEQQMVTDQTMSTVTTHSSEMELQGFTFEHSLGFLLNLAFQHLEALQTTDLALLINHCAYCLRRCINATWQGRVSSKAQETLALLYFASLMVHMEGLNTDLILRRCQDTQFVHLVIQHCLRFNELLPNHVLAKVCSGLSALVGNEDFQVNWKDFFREDDDGSMKDSFFAMQDKIFADVLAIYPEKRGEFRAFNDFNALLRRS